MAEATLKTTYVAIIMLFGHSDGPVKDSFEFVAFSIDVPASNFAPASPGDTLPVTDTLRRYFGTLVQEHRAEVAAFRPWRCIVCGKSATEILYSMLPPCMLTYAGQEVQSPPHLFAKVHPVCVLGGPCEHTVRTTLMPTHALPGGHTIGYIEVPKWCDNCGTNVIRERMVVLQLCGGCKQVS